MLCAVLPAFHSFTGCDYTPAFSRKGKKRPLAILEKDQRYQKVFAELGGEARNETVVQAIEDFTCLLYGAKKPMALNKYRHRVFEIAYAPKDPAKPFAKMKGVEASSLPPCEAEVRQQIERTAFVAKYWHDAHLNSVTKIPSKGWELIDDTSFCVV